MVLVWMLVLKHGSCKKSFLQRTERRHVNGPLLDSPVDFHVKGQFCLQNRNILKRCLILLTLVYFSRNLSLHLLCIYILSIYVRQFLATPAYLFELPVPAWLSSVFAHNTSHHWYQHCFGDYRDQQFQNMLKNPYTFSFDGNIWTLTWYF